MNKHREDLIDRIRESGKRLYDSIKGANSDYFVRDGWLSRYEMHMLRMIEDEVKIALCSKESKPSKSKPSKIELKDIEDRGADW